MPSADFDAVLAESRAALDLIAKGDPRGFEALFSSRDDITLGNPFGGFGRGRQQVVEQIGRAASTYRDGATTGFETVMHEVAGDLVYTVEIERFRAKVAGSAEMTELALRVTCVYRREGGGWKLQHRHADPRVERQTPESVVGG